jgi:4a-hydroxytetrahydrobiopterin dehydratase
MNHPSNRHCVPCRKGTEPLSRADVQAELAHLPGWSVSDDEKWLHKEFKFPDFAAALAFVNQIGLIAEAENHHPDLELGWGYVRIRLQTHAAGGLHGNDFILAGKIEML